MFDAIDVADILTAGRQAAEARMSDTCAITAPGTSPVWNASTETYDVPPGAAIYTGGCRVKLDTSRMSGEPDTGDRTHVVLTPSLHIPATATGVAVGQAVTITAASYNAALVGRIFRITSLFLDSQATAQRLDCTEVEA